MKNIKVRLGLTCLITLLVIFGIASSVSAATTVSIDPASVTASAGDSFKVNISVVPDGKGVSAGSVVLTFNASVLQATSVAAGDLLGSNPIAPPGHPIIDNTNGIITYDLVRFGATTVPTPNGTFAAITFSVKSSASAGTYYLNLTKAALADENVIDITGIVVKNGIITIIGTTTTNPVVSIDPASVNKSAGGSFKVNISVVPDGKGVGGGSMELTYNASVLNATSATAGDLLGFSTLTAPGHPIIDNTNGTIKYDLARVGATTVPTPNGTFAAITFSVKSSASAGTYYINLTKAALTDENFNDITDIKVNNGTVRVSSLLGDANGDGTVDFKDLSILSRSYGKNKGESGYDERADFNGDGTVDFKDLSILSRNYGKTA